MVKLWYYEQNYGTIQRTMELIFTKVKNMGAISTIEKNYDTIPKTMELWFTLENTMVLWKKAMVLK